MNFSHRHYPLSECGLLRSELFSRLHSPFFGNLLDALGNWV